MIWAYPDFRLSLLLAGLFILLYILYISRFWLINRRLKVEKQRLFTKLIIRTLYFILFLIAFAGPSIGNSFKEVKEEGKDIFIAVDLSQSMISTDVGPNRLRRIQFELKELLKSFPTDRIGLIIFSTEAFLQLPLTYDQSVANLYIDGLNIGLVPNMGTDLNAPLRMALERFQNDQSQEEKSKAVILISDGEHFGDDLEDISSELYENGIKVFTLGIGTTQGGQIPRGNGVVIDPQTGQPAISKLDPESLQLVAIETGGKYFEISDQVQEMGSLISSLESLEGGTSNTRVVEASSNKYFYFLLAALALALLDMILPIKTIKL
ncbi:vWA domain-containing protein [Algoriphagus sanaruensis]|uniref:Aerotolerance regulator BatB n=1 Tax=Algoriphagus sanaruensis TaxID=1727163 RepID=A0A142ENU4_9BACT|nr:VWA domain-containing protein [Algoriphagus sanaruensis]AMQ56799.1 aerotolerance regulator BatB [Algoriphagus sanaruensis]